MNAVDLIAKRRDGQPHSPDELAFLANGAAKGDVPDYQLSAWLMAAYLNPLSRQETADLTVAMANSGKRLDLSTLPQPTLDKHSTGGVGDKTTMVLLPLLASCGVTMVKMSGRGLGITGGTVDKLASIPGFRINLSPEELIEQAKKIGIAITGQTPDLAPADKALYALRDVTATVNSVPLIVSSILSKKLAGGSKNVLLDVKCGSGGFMPKLEDARTLASALKDCVSRVGLNLTIAITDMDQPLGRFAGNALEVKEAARVLRDGSIESCSARFKDLCIRLASLGLVLSGKAEDQTKAEEIARANIACGAAKNKAREWIEAQGGDASVFDRDDWSPANHIAKVTRSGQNGFVKSVNARAVGLAVVALGGGRNQKTDAIDPSVGVETFVEVGDAIKRGDTIFQIHAASEEQAKTVEASLLSAIEVSEVPVEKRPVILETL